MNNRKIILGLLLLTAALLVHPAYAQFGQTRFTVCATPSPTPTPTATPTPTPGPTPEFIVGAQNTSDTLTMTGIQAGDCVIGITGGGSTSTTNGWLPVINNTSFSGGGDINVFLHPVTPQDTTTIVLPNGSASSFCAAAFRYVVCSTDGIASLKQGTNGSPASNTYTTIINLDVGIWAAATNSTSTGVVSSPSGYTQAATQNAVSGSRYGCDLEYKFLSTAGSYGGDTGTLTNPSGWGVIAFGVPASAELIP